VFKQVDDLPGARRDRKLEEALAAIHHERAHEPLRVAAIYGAGHKPAVIEALGTLGYQPSTSEWLSDVETGDMLRPEATIRVARTG